jgi:hypothetical protein
VLAAQTLIRAGKTSYTAGRLKTEEVKHEKEQPLFMGNQGVQVMEFVMAGCYTTMPVHYGVIELNETAKEETAEPLAGSPEEGLCTLYIDSPSCRYYGKMRTGHSPAIAQFAVNAQNV